MKCLIFCLIGLLMHGCNKGGDSSSNQSNDSEMISLGAGESGEIESSNGAGVTVASGTFSEPVTMTFGSVSNKSVDPGSKSPVLGAYKIDTLRTSDNAAVQFSEVEKPVKVKLVGPNGDYQADSVEVWVSGGTQLLGSNFVKLDGINIDNADAKLTVIFSTKQVNATFALTGKKKVATKKPETGPAADETPPTPGDGGTLNVTNLTALSFVLSWQASSDDLTKSGELSYKVVRSNDGNIENAGDAEANGTVITDWTTGLTSTSITGLSESTTYQVNVLVMDASGNIAAYISEQVTTSDVTAPSVGTGLIHDELTGSSMRLQFGEGSDTNDASADLEYKIVHAASAAEIDTLAEADTSEIVSEWSPFGAVTHSGLSDVTQYCHAVLVRDTGNNISLYTPTCASTLDGTGPQLAGGFEFGNIGHNRISIGWEDPTDNVTSLPAIEIKVVTATTTEEIDTIAEAEALTGPAIVMDWATEETFASLNALSPMTTHCLAVLLRDEALNVTLLAPMCETTTNLPKNMFVSSWTGMGLEVGSVSAADAKCEADSNHPDPGGTIYKAVIVDGTNRSASPAIDWVLLPDTPYFSDDSGSRIGITDANGLFTFGLEAEIKESPEKFWTGLNPDWSTGDHCNGWSDTSSGIYGLVEGLDTDAISNATISCVGSSNVHLVCVEQ